MTSDQVPDDTRPAPSPSDPVERARLRSQAAAEPRQIGPYKILQTLGEGGMGIVYLAEQERPLHRRVALKLIKPGMDTKYVVARFETEREALALMDHPNVAKVFDAGATEQGRPYFVMEYVPGISIIDYCDRHRLSTIQRLRLFIEVCHAVQHAHQKGIIHRDIKPSNVLVTVQDDKPVPKVIDFGVAKATQHRLTERTVFTEHGQFVGTPGYMSPEQAEMSALGIDTRTDIYSLGVMLYELLVGVSPFDTDLLMKRGFAEIQRVIREVEPPKPSTRLSSMGEGSTAIAQKRQTEPRTLIRDLRGDLDWVVMKCIEKDRTRRYETANALAQEIQRFLNCEAVLAGPPSTSYRFKKFVRRNRMLVGAAAAVVVALSTGLSAASAMYVRAANDRRIAVHARDEADRQRRNAEANLAQARVAEERAQTEARIGNQYFETLVGILSDPAGALPTEAAGLGSLPQGAAAAFRPSALERPLLGHLETELSEAQGQHDPGRLNPTFSIPGLGPLSMRSGSPDAAASMNVAGRLLHAKGDLKRAGTYYLVGLATAWKERGENHPDTAALLGNLGQLRCHAGDFQRGALLTRRALEISQKAPGTLVTAPWYLQSNLGFCLTGAGDFQLAEGELLAAEKALTEKLGPEHFAVKATRGRLVKLYEEWEVKDPGQNHAEKAAEWRARLEEPR